MPLAKVQPTIECVSCIICAGREAERVSRCDRHGKPLDTVLCLGCGLVHNDPIPSDEGVAEFYRSRYRVEYKGAEEPRLRQIMRNFNGVLHFIEKNRQWLAPVRTCLDVGAGSGEFLAVGKALGWACRGIEPNAAYAAFAAQKYDLEIETATLDTVEFPDGAFDLIRLNHVVEHLNDPVRALKRLRRWLSDDGLLYIDVPDVAAYAARKTRGRIFHFGHIFNFNPATIKACAGRAGFAFHASVPEGAETTANFFRKGPERATGDATDPANAERIRQALRAHYASPRLGVALTRLVNRIKSRTMETGQAAALSSPEEIARQFGVRASALLHS